MTQRFLKDYVKIADIHAHRLQIAYQEVVKVLPLTAGKLEQLSIQEFSFLDMMTNRFVQLQNTIGSRIFPLLLEILAEDAGAFIDKLHKLEKLGYLEDTKW